MPRPGVIYSVAVLDAVMYATCVPARENVAIVPGKIGMSVVVDATADESPNRTKTGTVLVDGAWIRTCVIVSTAPVTICDRAFVVVTDATTLSPASGVNGFVIIPHPSLDGLGRVVFRRFGLCEPSAPPIALATA